MRFLSPGRKKAALLLSLVLSAGVFTVAAAQGSQSDPLVTLSYLTDVVTPSVLSKVDEQVAKERQTYLTALDGRITAYTAQMEQLLGGLSGSAGQNSAVFSVVELTAGQTLTGSVGCELMLRVGSAKCVSPASPGLVDATDGSVLENGKALTKNHLYMFTMEGRAISASDSIKLLVRGTYTVG
ncbi:hypothetical protein SDC9_120058 [bioreactor metagenome]|uniref:Uncharacterized protein n=1 Tax=bioreactor metagenome TaxID=1076179 RepID=A0A645C5Y0_9ZZZZ